MTDRFSYSRNGVQGRVDENCQVRVSIPGVDNTSGKHVAYRVRLTNIATRQTWEVSRRFSEFFKLRGELVQYLSAADKKCPGCVNYEKVLLRFEFPRKHLFTSDSPVVLKYRRVALTAFVALLASHTFTSSPKCPTCSGFSFTAVRDFLTNGLVVVDGPAAANSPVAMTAADDKQIDSIRDSMNVKDYTDYHPVASLRQVDSEGRFTSEMRVKTHKPRPAPPQPQRQPQSHADKRRSKPKRKEEPLPSPPTSTGSSSNPASPAAAEAVPPSPATAKRSSAAAALARALAEETKGEEEEFTSFTATEKAKQPRTKPLEFADSPTGERESTINFDDEEEEDINLDFMNSVAVTTKAN